MERGDPPECATCNVPLTVKHMLIDCDLFTAERRLHLLSGTMKEVLADDEVCVDRVLNFVQKIKMIRKL